MNKLAVILSLLCLLFGAMLGYSLAYGRIYQEVKKERLQSPPSPAAPSSSPEPDSNEPVSFAKVIAQSTGQIVLPLDSVCEPVLEAIEEAADSTLAKMNGPNSPTLGLRRINEASRFFEDSLLEILDAHPDLKCEIPVTREGKAQRSGYPDLILTHQATGRVFYLDPKLFEAASRDSSLRTFYYTPRQETSKILKNAHHLLIGFAHDGKDGAWNYESWHLVDLSSTNLKLKSEFNASNKELYRESTVIRESKR